MATEKFFPAGVMVALATPVRQDGTLDEAGLERLVARVVSGGVDGISPTGSTGEGARLTPQQRRAVFTIVRRHAPASMPVIPGVPVSTPEAAHAELSDLADAGATAALVAPPFYYPLSDSSVTRLYEGLAERSSLPLVLYNIPSYTKISIAPGVAARLASHPAIVGIKDSSRDMTYQQQLLYATAEAEFNVITGHDSLLVASLTLGAAGTIAASANLAPEVITGVHRAFSAGDMGTALRLQERLAGIIDACRRGYAPAGWKAALEIAGVCEAHLVPPGPSLTAAEKAGLVSRLTAMGIPEVPTAHAT